MIAPANLATRVQSRLHRHLIDAWQDRRLGIDASGLHWPTELAATGPNAEHGKEYFGTPTLVLARILNRLSIDPSRFVFVDLGSGKGRVVLHAAIRPFHQVVGVELSESMHQAASLNLASAEAGGRLRAPVRLINQDILDFELPELPLVLYMFDAFSKTVLNMLLDKIERSLAAHPRECFLVYVNAVDKDCIASRPLLSQLPVAPPAQFIDRLVCPWPLVIFRNGQQS
jgi:SAM-dependent methyltransferase